MRILKQMTILLAVLLLCACAGGLTRLPEGERKVEVTSALPGMTQLEILTYGAGWLEKNFTATTDPIALDDREEGRIIAVGQIDYPCRWADCIAKGDWIVSFDMYLDAVDQQLVTTFRNIRFTSGSVKGSAGIDSPLWSQRDLDAVRPKLLELNAELIADLLTAAPGE
ncbi:MAG: hypothetical protein C0622_14425 [Desulfuromonas sp.]|nr:MAG: hypothetical protein C0622_14425 [Desulfuromonas sp.]